MWKEFKQFAMKGNVVDLAVGVMIGSAFGAIVNSLVADVVMPVIGIVTGGIDFTGLSFVFGKATITYGKFIQASFSFLIVAFALFMVIKAIAALKREEKEHPTAPPEPSEEVLLLREIRDALKK
ncbi:MAG TPA: large-conductance mechanosensitive channel protein MscL [Candidatus Paceibacterota bacterium]|nr:large-conductance mechanosensitive channel protein MscL [Candidatus Paceibacterota bacterium]